MVALWPKSSADAPKEDLRSASDGTLRTKSSGRPPRVHIIVQNLPVPFDRRVWLECQALTAAGYRVSVVCPRGPGDPTEQVVDGVTLYKYRPPRTGAGQVAFVREYLYSFLATAWLTVRAWRRDRFDVLQACNPPDIFWPLALIFRLVGVRFVFDHHDLCPELYQSKFGDRRSMLHWGLLALEWCTFHAASHVVSTNESYRAIAMRRGGKQSAEVTVVRTGPNPDKMKPVPAVADLRRSRRYLVVYLGVMGAQDGVDLAVRVVDHIVHGLGRRDISFTFIGSGESFNSLLALRHELAIDDYIEFPGRIPDEEVACLLSTADVGLCPDPKNPLNDVSTMNKTLEYMAFGLPIVSFDLHETRISAGEAATYATPNEVADFAMHVVDLLADEPRRLAMGAFGRKRIVDTLAWSHQKADYVRVFDSLVSEGNTGNLPMSIADLAS